MMLHKFIAAAALFTLASPASAGVITVPAVITVPPNSAVQAGSSNNGWPFGMWDGATSLRYQQRFAASAFGTSLPLVLLGIEFRQDEIFGQPINYTTNGLTFGLSTSNTLTASNHLSGNVGPDERTVISGPVTFNSNYQGYNGATAPAPFDFVGSPGTELEFAL